MARTSVDMENHTCDDDRCDVTKPAAAGGDRAPAGWLVGTVARADDEGRLPVEAEWMAWEACRPTHVRGAVDGVLERDRAAVDEGSKPAPTGNGSGPEPTTRQATTALTVEA